MTRQDFQISANKGGYMIYYKEKPIGGAGTITGGKGLRGKAVVSQIKSYTNMAEYDISQILSGSGSSDMLRVIDRINTASPEA